MRLTLILMVGLIGACGQQRVYNVDDTPISSLNNKSLKTFVQEFNSAMSCDMWKLDATGAVMRWEDEEIMGKRGGFWHRISNEILINENLKDRGEWVVRFVSLHELGHAMGYGHVEEGCHVMSPSLAPCAGYNYEERVQDFLEQIERERKCLTELGY